MILNLNLSVARIQYHAGTIRFTRKAKSIWNFPWAFLLDCINSIRQSGTSVCRTFANTFFCLFNSIIYSLAKHCFARFRGLIKSCVRKKQLTVSISRLHSPNSPLCTKQRLNVVSDRWNLCASVSNLKTPGEDCVILTHKILPACLCFQETG